MYAIQPPSLFIASVQNHATSQQHRPFSSVLGVKVITIRLARIRSAKALKRFVSRLAHGVTSHGINLPPKIFISFVLPKITHLDTPIRNFLFPHPDHRISTLTLISNHASHPALYSQSAEFRPAKMVLHQHGVYASRTTSKDTRADSKGTIRHISERRYRLGGGTLPPSDTEDIPWRRNHLHQRSSNTADCKSMSGTEVEE